MLDAPEMVPDEFGHQLIWAWHFVRDQTLFFPYFRKDPQHARNQKVPSPAVIHGIVVDVRALSHQLRGVLQLLREALVEPQLDANALEFLRKRHKAELEDEQADPALVAKRLNEVVADFLKNGPTADEVKRYVTQSVSERIAGLESVGGFGGYENVMKQMNPGGRWTYGAATEMRKDGIALAY